MRVEIPSAKVVGAAFCLHIAFASGWIGDAHADTRDDVTDKQSETEHPEQRPSRPVDRPPTTPRFEPPRFEHADTLVAVLGRTLQIYIVAKDPEGRPVHITITGLPPTAVFTDSDGQLSYKPLPEHRGTYTLRISASDGQHTTERFAQLLVTDNHPPAIERVHETVRVGDSASIHLRGVDLDQDPLTWSAQGMPPGAVLHAESGVIAYAPERGDIGEHRVRVTASDGLTTSSSEVVIDVQERRVSREKHEWTSFFLPGVGYSIFAPREHARWGTMSGINMEILLLSWIHHNDNRGPSHGRIYLQAELLQSSRSDVSMMFSFALGTSLSLERNPIRKWLLPIFGLDIGGIRHDGMGAHFQSTPYFGIHAYSSQNFFATLRGGYRLVPSDVERLAGWYGSATIDLSLW